MSVEISSGILYQSVNIDDIMLFAAERRWNFPLIFYICLQHVDGNFQRHFLNLFKDTDDICFCIQNVSKTFYCKNADGTFYCKMSMEISIDIFLSIEDIDDILLLFSKTSVENFINTLHLYPKCRWKFPSTFCFYQ